ncbi:MAG: hypothetical protein VXW78_04095, partial [Pseudomonadota bacterium]|nr:hypothetical protein [Pseudomonadota bacterium]
DAPALLHIVPGKRMARRREARHWKQIEPVFHDHHGAEIGGKRVDDLAEDNLFISLELNLKTPLLKPASRIAVNLPSSHFPASLITTSIAR